jgi:topoisomerase-4 subunit B
MVTPSYNAESIEVLKGLDPVKRRPGMYTDTTRPNHLGMEVVDNSVDEAIEGFAHRIQVTLHPDDSLEVRDDGRGMPVDVHPEEGLPGVEVILTRLHAGAKFSTKNYRFSGGLHGVGVSVVNALSKWLEVEIKRDGKIYRMDFAHGDKIDDLTETGSVGSRNTGTRIRFWPEPQFFDSPRFSVPRLKHLLRAKAVLCPGLRVDFTDGHTGETTVWEYRLGLEEYLKESLAGCECLPAAPFTGDFNTDNEMVSWAVAWVMEGNESVTESYVNLIPTIQGGTHVNGFRSGLTAAIREFCDFRKLIPRGVKLAPDDVWDKVNFVLSVKMEDPQFSGQTKERLGSRHTAGFVGGVLKDAFSLWLNQHTQVGEQLAEMVIRNAQKRIRTMKQVTRKRVHNGPALPGKLADCTLQDAGRTELFLVEGDSAGGSAKQARERQFQAIMPLRGKILNTWEVDPAAILNSKEIHDIAVAIGVDPGSADLSGLRYGKICILADADSDGLHIATLICALFERHFPDLVRAGHVYVAMPPLYRIDMGKSVHYALDETEKEAIVKRLRKKSKSAKIQIQRFKGLGEMNPIQLRETTMAPDTRRLVRLTVNEDDGTGEVMDLLLGKKRAEDRRRWLEGEPVFAGLEHEYNHEEFLN